MSDCLKNQDIFLYFKDFFYAGWKKGRENGIEDGRIKLRLEMAISMIKYTDLDDMTILKILDRENEKSWADFLKRTRDKLNK